jgi:hypothetical protein
VDAHASPATARRLRDQFGVPSQVPERQRQDAHQRAIARRILLGRPASSAGTPSRNRASARRSVSRCRRHAHPRRDSPRRTSAQAGAPKLRRRSGHSWHSAHGGLRRRMWYPTPGAAEGAIPADCALARAAGR